MKKDYEDPFKRKEVRDDHVSIGETENEFTRVEEGGKITYRRKGYEKAEIPAPVPRERKTNKELWADYHANKEKK